MTEEQRAQARANIDKFNWITFSDSWGEYTYTLLDDNDVDYEIAKTITNVTNNGSINAMDDMVSITKSIALGLIYLSETPLLNVMKWLSDDYTALVDGKALSDKGRVIFYSYNALYETIEAKVIFYKYNESEYRLSASNYFNKIVNTVTYNKTINKIIDWASGADYRDTTLSKSGYLADAKAVGDALATKLNRDEALVKSLPILRKEVLAEGTKYETRISYVNVAAMEEACLYAMANKEETRSHQIRFVYICEDSTEKSIVNLSATGICYALHTYTNGLRMATTLWLPNATYIVDLSDSSTADNITVTGREPSEYLPVTNRIAYTPTGDYNPATKKYVDEAVKTVDVSEAVFITVEDIDEICGNVVEGD